MNKVFLVAVILDILSSVQSRPPSVKDQNLQTTYTAAVYEHIPETFSGGALRRPSDEEARDVIQKNLEIYKKQTKIAKDQVCDPLERGNFHNTNSIVICP